MSKPRKPDPRDGKAKTPGQPDGAQTWAQTLEELWLTAACAVLTEISGTNFEAGAKSETQSPRSLGVYAQVRMDGDFQGLVVFGVPASSREFTALLSQGKDGGSDEKSWSEFTEKVAHRWLELVLKQTGLVCTIELLGATRQSGPEQFGSGLFCTLGSGNLKVPVAISVAGDLTGVRALHDEGEIRSGQRASSAPDNFPPLADAQGANLDLLLDIELQASLRFGGREMSLEEILELGPGDVVSLDRTVQAPVDLVVGDRIVARGEVVLVDGNYGLRVTAVAEPRKRLETVRCLF
jgi:flagellar motor switch protein FliN